MTRIEQTPGSGSIYKLTVLDPSASTRFVIQVPARTLVSRLTSELPSIIGLPLRDERGQFLEYSVLHVRTDQEHLLEAYQSLAEAGVRDGDSLHVQVVPAIRPKEEPQSSWAGLSEAYGKLPNVQSMVERLAHRVVAKSPEWNETANEIRESLKKVEELLAQSMAENRAVRATRSGEAERDQKLYELLERTTSQLASGAHPQELSEVLRRICELLERQAGTVEQELTEDLKPQAVHELAAMIEALEARLQAVMQSTLDEQGDRMVPIIIPPEEKSPIVVVRVDRIRHLEQYRNEESKWRSNAHLFAGGIVGVLVNWATSQGQEISNLSIVVVGFFFFITTCCVRYALVNHRRAEEYRIDLGSKDDAHDQAIRTPTRSPEAGSGKSRSSGGAKKAPRRKGTRGGGGRGRPARDRGGAS